MCVVYLAWESNIAMERLEKVLQWHSVTVEGKAIHQNKFFAEIHSENLVRRDLCCFGKSGLVILQRESPWTDTSLSINDIVVKPSKGRYNTM